MTTMSVSEARASLPEILNRVLDGDEVTITRHGLPVAIVVHPDAIRARRAERVFADSKNLREQIDEARSAPLSKTPHVRADRADELIAQVDAARANR